MKKYLAILALTASLGGCGFFHNTLVQANDNANKYLPLVGQDVIMVANIIVQVECSPGLGVASAVGSNVLNIVAPNSEAAAKVQTALAKNLAVAQQLCPFVAAIKASVGAVPAITPSQVVGG